jgi:hypothetical protein
MQPGQPWSAYLSGHPWLSFSCHLVNEASLVLCMEEECTRKAQDCLLKAVVCPCSCELLQANPWVKGSVRTQKPLLREASCSLLPFEWVCAKLCMELLSTQLRMAASPECQEKAECEHGRHPSRLIPCARTKPAQTMQATQLALLPGGFFNLIEQECTVQEGAAGRSCLRFPWTL